MFNCYLHGWSNPTYVCPICSPTITTTSNSSDPISETGLSQMQEAYRYRRIHGAVMQMGGMANFAHWVNNHAKNYFNSLELEQKKVEKLRSTLKKVMYDNRGTNFEEAQAVLNEIGDE